MPVKNNIIKEDLTTITSFREVNWQRFNGKTVLITGANGFLPAYMVETLLFLNDSLIDFKVTVLALVRNKAKAEKRFIDYLEDTNLFFIEQDVCNDIKIEGGIDFIIHAASQASPKYYGIDPVGTLNANVLGTINLMKLASEKKVESFLYFSSGEVYGEVESDKMPLKETDYGYLDPTVVRSCYAESKRMGETICVSYLHQYGVPIKIVRPFHTYGPGMALDDGRVYADFVSDILQSKNIKMKSDGKAKRSFCYLSDATLGFFTVLLEGIVGNAYNIGNPSEEYSILELAKVLVTLFPEKSLEVEEFNKEIPINVYIKSAVNRITPNIEKMKGHYWNPIIKIREGFFRTIASYKIS